MLNIKAWLGLTYYISPLDQFLKEFDEMHPPLSVSQQKEITKYQRVFALRDNPNYDEPKKKFWDQF